MHIRAAVCAAVISVAPMIASADDKYTMEDLRALAENDGWGELLEHVEDIRPRDRKKEWRSMLEKAAIGQLGILESQKKRYEGLAASEQILTRFTVLKKSKPYMKKRAEVGLIAFKECFSNRYGANRCASDLMDFIKVDPKNTDLAFSAGKVVTGDAGKLWQAGPEFFVLAMTDKKNRKRWCKDGDVGYSTLATFGGPPKYDSVKAASAIAFDHCYPQMKVKLEEKLNEEASGYTGYNLCKGLTKRKHKLSAFQSAVCKDLMEKYDE